MSTTATLKWRRLEPSGVYHAESLWHKGAIYTVKKESGGWVPRMHGRRIFRGGGQHVCTYYLTDAKDYCEMLESASYPHNDVEGYPNEAFWLQWQPEVKEGEQEEVKPSLGIGKAPTTMLDIQGMEAVQVSIREDGKVLWVNGPNGCILRICQIEKLELVDAREQKKQQR